MFGKNKIAKINRDNGQILEIHNIFDTFQGEALYSGYPATFIRLSGCNLQCNFCDTNFEDINHMSIAEIIAKIKHKLVVITGGEPLRQNITPLCQKLLAKNHLVQIETNGTIFLDLPSEVEICCSPKISNGKYHQIRPDLISKITFFKFLISKYQIGYDHIPNFAKNNNIPIYLQAMDEYNAEKNTQNKELTLKLAKKNNCRLSLQTHKIWSID